VDHFSSRHVRLCAPPFALAPSSLAIPLQHLRASVGGLCSSEAQTDLDESFILQPLYSPSARIDAFLSPSLRRINRLPEEKQRSLSKLRPLAGFFFCVSPFILKYLSPLPIHILLLPPKKPEDIIPPVRIPFLCFLRSKFIAGSPLCFSRACA